VDKDGNVIEHLARDKLESERKENPKAIAKPKSKK